MAEIRISQLTAKSSNLASTDEFAIAESDGAGGFVSKKINGAQLKDSTIKCTNGYYLQFSFNGCTQNGNA